MSAGGCSVAFLVVGTGAGSGFEELGPGLVLFGTAVIIGGG